MTGPTTPTGQRIVTRLLDTLREWDDEASGDNTNDRRREARSRVACLSEVLRWLPRELAAVEDEAVRMEDARMDAIIASVPGGEVGTCPSCQWPVAPPGATHARFDTGALCEGWPTADAVAA